MARVVFGGGGGSVMAVMVECMVCICVATAAKCARLWRVGYSRIPTSQRWNLISL